MKFLSRKFFLLVVAAIFFSCSSNLNFEQVEDFQSTPVFNISLGFFEVTSRNFLNTSPLPVTSISNDLEYRIFENLVLKDNLVKQEFDIKIANTFNSGFVLSINFLDDNGKNTFTPSSFLVSANTTNFEEKIIINNIDTTNSNVKNTTNIRITVRLEDESMPLRETSTGTFSFKSSTTVFLKTFTNND